MPPASDNGKRISSIRYTAVDDGLAPGSNTTVDLERSARSPSPNSKLTEPSIQKTSLLSSEGTTPGYKGPSIAGWPIAPRRLRGFSVPLFIGDALLILFPVAFLALGITAWSLNGKELSKTGTTVQSAMNLGPTVYPLAFAAIGSRCFRNIAVRLAERGTTIATLEKLLGSHSLISTIGTAVNLRSISLLSLSIVALWGLSPLGGQSSLRLLSHANLTVSESGTVYYSDHNAPFDPDEFTKVIEFAPAILTASLASSEETRALPVDLWKHPKIPRLDAIEQLALNGATTEGEWIHVDSTAEQKYSSWAGVSIQNMQQNGQSEFQVRYNYLYHNCEVLFSGAPYNVWKDMLAAELAMYPSLPTNLSEEFNDYGDFGRRNTAANFAMTTLTWKDAKLPMFVRYAHSSKSTDKFKDDTGSGFEIRNQTISFLYGTDYVDPSPGSTGKYDNFQVHACTPHHVTLQAQISCQVGNCAAVKLRYIPGPSLSTLGASCDRTYTIGCLGFGSGALYTFIRWLPLAMMSPLNSPSNAFNEFITDSASRIRIAGQVSNERISDRLSIVLNTFFQAVAWGPQITNASLFGPPQFRVAESPTQIAPERRLNTTEARFSQTLPIYKANVGWIVALLLITAILFILSIANIVISFMTIAPDLFYYASSLARENPYTDTPDGGTAMDGGERSRLLRAMRVQIADVSPDSRVGYVVFKSLADEDDCETGRLKKDRLYW